MGGYTKLGQMPFVLDTLHALPDVPRLPRVLGNLIVTFAPGVNAEDAIKDFQFIEGQPNPFNIQLASAMGGGTWLVTFNEKPGETIAEQLLHIFKSAHGIVDNAELNGIISMLPPEARRPVPMPPMSAEWQAAQAQAVYEEQMMRPKATPEDVPRAPYAVFIGIGAVAGGLAYMLGVKPQNSVLVGVGAAAGSYGLLLDFAKGFRTGP
jgi:hypothetical protein